MVLYPPYQSERSFLQSFNNTRYSTTKLTLPIGLHHADGLHLGLLGPWYGIRMWWTGYPVRSHYSRTPIWKPSVLHLQDFWIGSGGQVSHSLIGGRELDAGRSKGIYSGAFRRRTAIAFAFISTDRERCESLDESLFQFRSVRNCGFELRYVQPDSFYQPIAEPCASRMGKYLRANRSWAFTGEEVGAKFFRYSGPAS